MEHSPRCRTPRPARRSWAWRPRPCSSHRLRLPCQRRTRLRTERPPPPRVQVAYDQRSRTALLAQLLRARLHAEGPFREPGPGRDDLEADESPGGVLGCDANGDRRAVRERSPGDAAHLQVPGGLRPHRRAGGGGRAPDGQLAAGASARQLALDRDARALRHLLEDVLVESDAVGSAGDAPRETRFFLFSLSRQPSRLFSSWFTPIGVRLGHLSWVPSGMPSLSLSGQPWKVGSAGQSANTRRSCWRCRRCRCRDSRRGQPIRLRNRTRRSCRRGRRRRCRGRTRRRPSSCRCPRPTRVVRRLGAAHLHRVLLSGGDVDVPVDRDVGPVQPGDRAVALPLNEVGGGYSVTGPADDGSYGIVEAARSDHRDVDSALDVREEPVPDSGVEEDPRTLGESPVLAALGRRSDVVVRFENELSGVPGVLARTASKKSSLSAA